MLNKLHISQRANLKSKMGNKYFHGQVTITKPYTEGYTKIIYY